MNDMQGGNLSRRGLALMGYAVTFLGGAHLSNNEISTGVMLAVCGLLLVLAGAP